MLRVNTRLELQILDGPSRGTYMTHIEDVSTASFKVALPTVQGRPITLLAGDPVRCQIFTEGALYQFDAKVLGRELAPVPLVALATPTRFEKMQRRDFVRLEVNLPVRYSLVPGPGGPDGPAWPPETVRSRTVDLSGGGCAVLVPEALAAGTLLDLFIVLPGAAEVYATAEVIRVVRFEPGAGHVTGLRFVGMSERDRDEIIRYIFREQRDRRRRGLA